MQRKLCAIKYTDWQKFNVNQREIVVGIHCTIIDRLIIYSFSHPSNNKNTDDRRRVRSYSSTSIIMMKKKTPWCISWIAIVQHLCILYSWGLNEIMRKWLYLLRNIHTYIGNLLDNCIRCGDDNTTNNNNNNQLKKKGKCLHCTCMCIVYHNWSRRTYLY